MRSGTEKESRKEPCEGLAEYFALPRLSSYGEAGLCTAGEGFLAFGDNLYRMPERMPVKN
ncbi:MAG: hypothetical protein ACLUTY_13105 [Waltera sp.]